MRGSVGSGVRSVGVGGVRMWMRVRVNVRSMGEGAREVEKLVVARVWVWVRVRFGVRVKVGLG